MFIGTYEVTIDRSGRLTIPVGLREAIRPEDGNCLFVTNRIDQDVRLLDVYSEAGWNEFRNGLHGAPGQRLGPGIQGNLRQFYEAAAWRCPLDTRGRITIPKHLREFAGLSDEVMLFGEIDLFTIVSAEVARSFFRDAEDSFLRTDPDSTGTAAGGNKFVRSV